MVSAGQRTLSRRGRGQGEGQAAALASPMNPTANFWLSTPVWMSTSLSRLGRVRYHPGA